LLCPILSAARRSDKVLRTKYVDKGSAAAWADAPRHRQLAQHMDRPEEMVDA